jgi:hypothetical protein
MATLFSLGFAAPTPIQVGLGSHLGINILSSNKPQLFSVLFSFLLGILKNHHSF